MANTPNAAQRVNCIIEILIFPKVSTCIAKTKKCWDDDDDENGNEFAVSRIKLTAALVQINKIKGDETELLMCPNHAWRRLNSF